MNCGEWKDRFTAGSREHGIRELSVLPAELSAHPSGCSSCRRAHDALSALTRPADRTVSAPGSLVDNVMAAIAARAGDGRYRHFPWPALAAPIVTVAGLV